MSIQEKIMLNRIKVELGMLEKSPPPGISAWLKDNKLTALEAKIQGPIGTPYENGIFSLDITISENYPHNPPNVRFTTPIYHPNIDDHGRICLDIINMPPKGAWKPSLNILTVLTSIQSLLAEPNPDDALMADIAAIFKNNRALFEKTAKQWTQKHALSETNSSNTKSKYLDDSSDDSSEDEAEQKSVQLEKPSLKRPASPLPKDVEPAAKKIKLNIKKK